MSDYVLIRKGRNIISAVLHALFNLILGLGSVFITFSTASWIPGAILVILSKWRMFAVRPRYLFLNLKSNLVDLIVGFSFIFITYCSGPTLLPIHFILAISYSAWLIVLKPMSSERASALQSLLAVFLGTTATTLMTATANSIFPVFLNFLVGFAAARHVLVQGDDTDFSFLSLIIGLLFTEISWLSQSWLIVYTYREIGFLLPQSAILLTALTFLLGYIFKNYSSNEDFSFSKIATPTIFSIILIVIIVLWFSKPLFNV